MFGGFILTGLSLHVLLSCASHSRCWSPLLDSYFSIDHFFILLKRVFRVIQGLTLCRGGIIFSVLISFVFLTVLESFSFSLVGPCPRITLTFTGFLHCLPVLGFFSLSGFLLHKHRKCVVGHTALSGAK